MRLLVTRDDYFSAAMELLGSQGAGALKIGVLCKRLKVTTGSFYGYFGSLDGFVRDFLAYWEEQQTERIVALMAVPELTTERVHLLKELARELPHAAEAAIRSWANANPVVAEAQRRVDDRRIEALSGLLEQVVGPAEAERLAMLGMTWLVGYQQWRPPVSPEDFDRIFDAYEEMLLVSIAQASGRNG